MKLIQWLKTNNQINLTFNRLLSELKQSSREKRPVLYEPRQRYYTKAKNNLKVKNEDKT